MARIAYIEKAFRGASLAVIEQANTICSEYRRQGFDLTLRQLYYQFVSRGLIANRDTEYKRLGSIVNDARLAGYLDWDYIVDRTRNLRGVNTYTNPAEIIDIAARGYKEDRWADQDVRPEVWIEKDALVGVIERVCQRNQVDYFSCRGYVSQSEVWGAAQRLMHYQSQGQTPVIIHLGDHDPSGIDMTRDLRDRLALFCQHHGFDAPEIVRIALNMDQVEQYQPPPNPAKLTDSRCADYIMEHGHSSWELDALDPTTLADLIQAEIEQHRDAGRWSLATEHERRERETLLRVERNWAEVAEFAEGLE